MPTPIGLPRSQFWTEQLPFTKYRTLTPARAPGGDRGYFRPHQLSAGIPGLEGGEGARFLRRDELGSQNSQLAGRGEGARADPHIPRPRPLLAQSGLCLSPLVPRYREAAAEPPERGQERRGAPKLSRSPARRVSAGRSQSPGAALRQPSHRGARVPLRGPGLSGVAVRGAQGPGCGH